jgi:hypothetical protein
MNASVLRSSDESDVRFRREASQTAKYTGEKPFLGYPKAKDEEPP